MAFNPEAFEGNWGFLNYLFNELARKMTVANTGTRRQRRESLGENSEFNEL
jgi:hypothetical protein